MKIKQLVFKELIEIIELWPNISISRHLRVILRPNKDIYDWEDSQLLSKIQNYRKELENNYLEDSGNIDEDDNDSYFNEFFSDTYN